MPKVFLEGPRNRLRMRDSIDKMLRLRIVMMSILEQECLLCGCVLLFLPMNGKDLVTYIHEHRCNMASTPNRINLALHRNFRGPCWKSFNLANKIDKRKLENENVCT